MINKKIDIKHDYSIIISMQTLAVSTTQWGEN